MSEHNDLLTDEELSRLTGVELNARNRETKMVEVLDRAGIFHWWKHSGGIATTWHHVHGAQHRVARGEVARPNFGAAR